MNADLRDEEASLVWSVFLRSLRFLAFTFHLSPFTLFPLRLGGFA
ncbi:MAG TPA: hypothetical protein VE641_05570 [Chthoniobacterales bacterium]|nr:hypothetical protein [Chthoniobacterales bacterium]